MVRTPTIGDAVPAQWNISPSAALLARLEDLGDRVLVGPGREADEVVYDDAFAVRFPDALQDFCVDAGIAWKKSPLQFIGNDLDRHAFSLWSGPVLVDFAHDELRIVEAVAPDGTDLGVLALGLRSGGDGATIRGLFTGSTLAVSDTYRGFGIGRALAMARLIRDEELPTWEHDKPGYSDRGAATILSAARAIARLEPAAAPEMS